MKRLLICCDGTWNRPDSAHITNVEKIARTVQTDPRAAGGVHQLVYYISGVGGAGYKTDRILGGAFGFGLFHNVLSGYRFLAQNYEPGDEIFIVGFSRGAYTARSLGGMVARAGLLTKAALVEEKLPQAVTEYQRKDPSAGASGASLAEFRRDNCHPDAPVQFLGVFDTVGALGVPGASRKAPKFHDVQLSDAVRCARQALAIDEGRLKFAPTLWESKHESTEDPRVKQVWFEGAHSDVGGGYGETGLSDSALLWMVTEAHQAGLVFDTPLLSHYIESGSSAIRHNPVKPLFKVHNLILSAKMKLGMSKDSGSFSKGLRLLTNERALSLRIASTAATHFREGGYAPANLTAFAEATNDFDGIIEPVVALPEKGVDLSHLGSPPIRVTQG
jgi:uncharacterized protein (DUF2235 family)